jgi:hypothetical protein
MIVDEAQLATLGVAPEREAEASERVQALLSRLAVGPDEIEMPLAFRVYEAF